VAELLPVTIISLFTEHPDQEAFDQSPSLPALRFMIGA
jgi:hypothetical protein